MQDPLNLGIENLNVTMLEPLAFASKTLNLTEHHFANIKWEVLVDVPILHILQSCPGPQWSQATGLNHEERHW